MSSDNTDSADFESLPPSAKYVYEVLDRDGPLSRRDLQERTQLPERTVDRALDRLRNGDFIYTTRDSEDLRVVVCQIDD